MTAPDAPVRIVIPDDYPPAFAGTGALEELRGLGHVELFGSKASGSDEIVERLAGAHFAVNVRSYTVFDAALLDRLPELRMIAVFGAGTDNIDAAQAARLGIGVTNAPGANARSVAEHTWALTLAVARRLPLHERGLRDGAWSHHGGIELEGKTFGVVGLGYIGRHVARIAAGFGMRVLGWSPTRDDERARSAGVELVELDTLLRTADVVSLHVAVGERTRGLLDARALALLKPSAILINTARGALIDEPALVAVLSERRLWGAGLDVFVEEPLPPGHPLTHLDNVVITPHAGWVTDESRARLLRVPVENIRAWLAGKPRNVINPDVLARLRR